MSNDFFNQSFSSSSVTQRRKPPPPPPPPAGSGGSGGSANTVNTAGSSTRTSGRSSVPPAPSSGGLGSYRPVTSTSSATSSAGTKPSTFYNSQNQQHVKHKRPTGDYYPTTTMSGTNSTSNSTANAAVTTHTHTSNTTQFHSYTNPYATTSTSKKEDDWFTNEDDTPQTQSTLPSSSSSYYNPSHNTNMNYNNNNDSNVIKSESMEILSASMNAPNPNGNSGSIGFTGNMTLHETGTHATMHHNNNDYNNNMNMNTTAFTSQNGHTFQDYSNEPPLLEELGINLDHIKTKSLAVILPMKYAKTHIDKSIMEDSDLAGPLVYGLLLATELLLAGKISFGVIYGFGLFSSLATTLVLNLMSPSDSISIWTSVSILGYSLLPVNVLAAINIFYRIKFMGTLGVMLASVTIAWCTISSTRLIEKGCEMRQQRWLVGYPNALLYSAFVMLTIF